MTACKLIVDTDGLPETTDECTACEEANYVLDDYEKVCPLCQHAPGGTPQPQREGGNPWQHFWDRREDYSGFYGPERVKMVGGFAKIYIMGDEIY